VASVWPLYYKVLIGGVLQRWLSFWKVLLQKCFGTLPQISVSTQHCLGALLTIPSTSWLSFCSDMHCQLWDLICVPFQIMSSQLNFPQADSNQVVETSRKFNGNRMHLSSISSLIEKFLNTSVNKVFLLKNGNTFAKIYSTVFALLLIWSIACRLMRKCIYLITFRIRL
jgi:hypothetical protein